MLFVLVLNESYSSSCFLSRLLGLQFCQCLADGIQLCAGRLVDVVLVVKDVVNFQFQILKVLA